MFPDLDIIKLIVTTDNTLCHQYEFAFAPPDAVKHSLPLSVLEQGKTRSTPALGALIDWRARAAQGQT